MLGYAVAVLAKPKLDLMESTAYCHSLYPDRLKCRYVLHEEEWSDGAIGGKDFSNSMEVSVRLLSLVMSNHGFSSADRQWMPSRMSLSLAVKKTLASADL